MLKIVDKPNIQIKVGNQIKYFKTSKKQNMKKYFKGIVSKIEDKILVIDENLKEEWINFNMVEKVYQIPVDLKNYKEKEPLSEFESSINGKNYTFSIHAQKRLISRGIMSKIKLKETLYFIRSEFKERKIHKRQMLRELLKHDKHAKFLYNKRYDLILVLNEKQSIVLTAYLLTGSKLEN